MRGFLAFLADKRIFMFGARFEEYLTFHVAI